MKRNPCKLRDIEKEHQEEYYELNNTLMEMNDNNNRKNSAHYN